MTPEPTTCAPSRSGAERFVRQLLVIGDQAPRALVSLKGSIGVTAVRCILTYVVIPVLAPLISWLGVLATPASLVLSLVAIGLALNSLRRVWMAEYRHRWPYTAFIAVVVVLLAITAVLDTLELLT